MSSYKEELYKRLRANPELAQEYLEAAKEEGEEVYAIAKQDIEEAMKE